MGNLDGRCWRLHWPGTSISNTRRSEALPLLDMLFPHQSLNEAYEVHPILATVHPFPGPDNQGFHSDDTDTPSDSRERFKRIQSLFSLSSVASIH
jgi:hypothetical protein